MNQIGKFLSSLYRDETITAILEEAINGRFQITFVIRENGQERALSRGDLSAIRDAGFENKAEIEIEAPSSRMIGDGLGGQLRQTISFGRRQNVGYSDLRVNEQNLISIEAIFGDGDKRLVLPLPILINKVEQENANEITEEEADLVYFKNPTDRDPRLREDAIKMLVSNPAMKLIEIHNKLIEQEKGKSDVTISVLKYVVQYDDIKREANRRSAEKSKSEKVR